MAPKRAREEGKTKSGKAKRKARAKSSARDARSDAHDVSAPHDDIILVDSDDDVVVVESDDDIEGVAVLEDGPEKKKARLGPKDDQKGAAGNSRHRNDENDKNGSSNEVTENNDFIGFEPESDNEVAGNNDFIGFASDSGEESEEPPAQLFPWVKGQDHSQQKEIADWLTLEIKDFVNYISPAKEEIMVRNNVVQSLKEHIRGFWPATQAHVFGSSATDLYLPGSDIDMVVISESGDYESRQRLYQLSSYLRTNRLAKNIEVIANAKVPIIKFVDPAHDIHVDVSFERTNGIDAARRIRRWLDSTPGLRELVLIIKQFLRSRRLNNVHMGGLGGYATIIMVYHFLKLHPRVSTGNISVLENLGTLLIEFFELYGRNFSYDNLIISLTADDQPRYLPKAKHPYLGAGRGSFCIVIQDPSDPSNNITRSSYNLRDLRKAFGGAYQLLTAKCFDLHGASYKHRLGQSILGDIIKVNGDSRDFNDDRDLVANTALIGHEDSESDGANGNDKYYLSEMTEDESVAEPTPAEKKKKKRLERRKEKKRMERDLKQKEQELRTQREASLPSGSTAASSVTSSNGTDSSNGTKASSAAKKPGVSDYLSLDTESDSEKPSKRDYWSSKGLETV